MEMVPFSCTMVVLKFNVKGLLPLCSNACSKLGKIVRLTAGHKDRPSQQELKKVTLTGLLQFVDFKIASAHELPGDTFQVIIMKRLGNEIHIPF